MVFVSPVNEKLATTEEHAESKRQESSAAAAEHGVAHHSQHHLQALSSLDCALSQVGRYLFASSICHKLRRYCLLEAFGAHSNFADDVQRAPQHLSAASISSESNIMWI